MDPKRSPNLPQNIEYAFGWVYVLEALLKVSALGFCNYWRQGANRVDFLITWIILIGQTALILDPHQTVASKVRRHKKALLKLVFEAREMLVGSCHDRKSFSQGRLGFGANQASLRKT